MMKRPWLATGPLLHPESRGTMRTNDPCKSPGRRRALIGALQLTAAAAALRYAPAALIPTVSAQPRGNEPPPRGTKIVLLGTRGGPGIDLARNETGAAVVVDGVTYLVDCGYGTLRALVANGLAYTRIGNVFLSHLHDDHTADLPALLTHQWTNSRNMPTEVYGPFGTVQLVDAINEVLDINAEIRIADEGRTTRPEALFKGHDLPANATPTEVLKDERVHVTAIENTHYPERSKAHMPYRSLAFRFDTAEKSVAFSGDTAYSANVVKLARGADFFVCEVMAQSTYDRMEARAKAEAEAGNSNTIARHVAETHSTPRDVGRMAKEAGVKTVVLYHQLWGPRQGQLEYPVTEYIDGVHENFSGEVVVGRDSMVF
jgi:ribonuclease BN (tRNA processing enzyme)